MFCVMMVSAVVLATSAAEAATDASWLADFRDKYSYDVVKDQRTTQLVNQTFSADNCDGKDLKKNVLESLGGPGEPVEFRANQFAMVHACKRHACNEISMVWADVKHGGAASAYTDLTGGPVYVSSRDFSAKDLDRDFKTDLDSWLGKVNWNGKKPKIVFCRPNGKTEVIAQ